MISRSNTSRRSGTGRRTASVLMLLALASAGSLAAQTADLDEILSRYAAEDAVRLEAVILAPRWDGFPTELLLAKADEGAAKGVRAEVLLAALTEYARRLDRANGILGDRATVTALEATADVLEHDVPEDVVRTVAAVNPKEDQLAASMVALGDLIDAGVPPREAETLLLDAATQRRGNEDVLHLPAQVRRWIRQGYQPTDAAAEVRRTLDLPGQPKNPNLLDRYTPPPDRPF